MTEFNILNSADALTSSLSLVLGFTRGFATDGAQCQWRVSDLELPFLLGFLLLCDPASHVSPDWFRLLSPLQKWPVKCETMRTNKVCKHKYNRTGSLTCNLCAVLRYSLFNSSNFLRSCIKSWYKQTTDRQIEVGYGSLFKLHGLTKVQYLLLVITV